MVVDDAEKVCSEDNGINETVHDALDANEVFQHAPGDTPPDLYAPLAILDDISGGYWVI